MGVMNKKKGLRKTPYFTSDELIQWMKLATLCGELDASSKETQDKEWRRLMRCSFGMIWKVVQERIALIDEKQKRSVIRRREHSKIKMITSDEERVPNQSDTQEHVTIAYEDLLDLTDLALNSCCACPQGECVKDCYFRKVMHRLSLPVCRDELKAGECEFNWRAVGETEQVVPQNQRPVHYYAEDYVL